MHQDEGGFARLGHWEGKNAEVSSLCFCRRAGEADFLLAGRADGSVAMVAVAAHDGTLQVSLCDNLPVCDSLSLSPVDARHHCARCSTRYRRCRRCATSARSSLSGPPWDV